MENETIAQIVALVGIGAFAWLGRKFDRAAQNAELNWNPTTEEALEAAEFAAYCNRRGESHLRLVSAGQYGTKDREAIRR
jgi:hypothetical protein